jgi:predicted AAA+ superfamily ATPase
MKEVFKELIVESQTQEFEVGFPRALEIAMNTRLIVSVIGARRSGKTTYLFQLIQKLIKSGVPQKNILFINFEDERLKVDVSQLDSLLQAYNELYPEVNWQEVHLFFDEIQNVEGWERFVRRVYDTKTRHIYVSGSNAKLLSTEIATSLRGRSLSYTVYPFSFLEYLYALKVPVSFKTQQEKSRMIHHTESYMQQGGFAETLFLDQPTRVKLLQEYYNVMMFRDIVERYQISNINVLRFFIKKIFAGVTVPFSVNKVYNDLKSMGYKTSNNNLYEYLEHCQAVFLTQAIDKFDFSEIKQAKSEKKLYAIDTGFLSAIDFPASKNWGKLFENMIFMEFNKIGKKLAYFKTRYECDFILEEEGEFYPIQVSYRLMESETRKREFRGLIEACKTLGVQEGTVITLDQYEIVEFNGYKINIVPFYAYFLK